eukprot:3309167-Prymnesium_polylepis.1
MRSSGSAVKSFVTLTCGLRSASSRPMTTDESRSMSTPQSCIRVNPSRRRSLSADEGGADDGADRRCAQPTWSIAMIASWVVACSSLPVKSSLGSRTS